MKSSRKKLAIHVYAFILTAIIFHTSLMTEPIEVSATEEENTDDFAVHPAQRWDDEVTDEGMDQITGDAYEIYTLNNATSGSETFAKSRGLRNKDATLTSQFSLDIGGNTSYFLRDYWGDPADFTEDDDEQLNYNAGAGATDTVNEGIMAITVTGTSNTYIRYVLTASRLEVRSFSTVVYDTFTMRVKGSEANTRIILYAGDAFVSSYYTLSGEWDDIAIDLSEDSDWSGDITPFYIYFYETATGGNLDANEMFYIDQFEFSGSLDFASAVNGQVEDTWDWGENGAGANDDSQEYFYDTLGNVSDFNDGTTEQWIAQANCSISNNADVFQNALLISASQKWTTINFTNSIVAGTYSWLTFEFQLSTPMTSITALDGSGNTIFTDSTGWTAGTKHLFSRQLVTNWSGTESGLRLMFYNSLIAPWSIYLNFTYIYSAEKGDLESWSDLDRMYVNPEGYLVGTCAALASDTFRYNPVTKTIDTERFTTASFRIRSLSNVNVYIFGRNSLGAFPSLSTTYALTAGSWLQTTCDLTQDTDWTGTFNALGFVVTDDSGNLEGTEIIQLDYFLVLGSWSENDGFALSFLNDDKETGLDFKFTREQDSTNYTFTTSLYDASGISQSYTDSFYYDFDVDGWLFLKTRYDFIEKEMTLDLEYENGSEIVNLDRMSEIFPLFTTGILIFGETNIYLCLNNSLGPLSRSLATINHINAKFSERSWKHTAVSTDSEIISDSWDGVGWDVDVGETISAQTSTYQLVVPDLDGFSASFSMSADTSYTSGWPNAAFLNTEITFFNTDKINGSLIELGSFWVGGSENLGAMDAYVTAYLAGVTSMSEQEVIQVHQLDNMTGYFGFSLDPNRGNFTGVCYIDTPTWRSSNIYLSGEIGDIVDHPSYEFVIETKYVLSFPNVTSGTMGLSDVLISYRYMWEGIDLDPQRDPDATEDEPATSRNPIIAVLQELVRGIGSFFKIVGTAISDAINYVLRIILGVLNSIFAQLASIYTVLSGLAAAIAVAIWATAETALAFLTSAIEGIWLLLEDAIPAIIGWINDVADDVAALLYTVWEYLVDLFISGTSTIIGLLAAITFAIWDGFWIDVMGADEAPDLIAITVVFISITVDVAVGLPDFLTDCITFIFEWGVYAVILCFAFNWLVPAFSSSNIGDFFANFFNIYLKDLSGGTSIIGIHVPIPFGVIWSFLLIFYSGTNWGVI